MAETYVFRFGKCKEEVKVKIKAIYDESEQNYCATKITNELLKDEKTISGRTVGKYMKEMDSRAQWVTMDHNNRRFRF